MFSQFIGWLYFKMTELFYSSMQIDIDEDDSL